MNALQHQKESERLLAVAKKFLDKMASEGSQSVNEVMANLQANSQVVAMAHVHALLAKP